MERIKQQCIKLSNLYLLTIITLLPQVIYAANAGGLERPQAKLTTFKDWLISVSPVIASIALVVLAIGWALGFIDKKSFFTWGAACLIIGSASSITTMFIS